MSETAALNAIRQQLTSRTDGKVWIDDWRDRFGWVAPTPKDLMLRHPDKFKLSFVGNRYTVALKEGGSWKQSKGAGKGAPKTVPVRFPQAGSSAPQAVHPPWSSNASPGKGGWVGKGGKAGKGAKGGPGVLALPAPQGTKEDAVKEIRRQLAANKDGYVWINNWRRRFGSLADTQKEFLEKNPDIFFLSFEGKRYSVEYIGPQTADEGTPGPRAAGLKRPAESANQGWRAKAAKTEDSKQEFVEGTEDEAVAEFVKQLKNPKNKDGKVWIPGFSRRFGHLGISSRDILECHPEFFTVVPGKGNSYTVRLAEDAPEEAAEEPPPEEPAEEAPAEAEEEDGFDGFEEEV